jgi:hypothetical protein
VIKSKPWSPVWCPKYSLKCARKIYKSIAHQKESKTRKHQRQFTFNPLTDATTYNVMQKFQKSSQYTVQGDSRKFRHSPRYTFSSLGNIRVCVRHTELQISYIRLLAKHIRATHSLLQLTMSSLLLLMKYLTVIHRIDKLASKHLPDGIISNTAMRHTTTGSLRRCGNTFCSPRMQKPIFTVKKTTVFQSYNRNLG